MSQHSQGSGGTGIAVVLCVVVGGGALLVMLAVAGAALFWLSAPMPAAPQVEVAWSEPAMAEKLTVAGDASFPLRVENATRQADGGWKILVAGSRTGPGRIQSMRFSNVWVADLEVNECQVTLPSGPFGKTIDFVIHTPSIPVEREKIRIDYVVYLQGSDDSGGGFSDSLDGTLEVDLKNRAPRVPVKAEALPE